VPSRRPRRLLAAAALSAALVTVLGACTSPPSDGSGEGSTTAPVIPSATAVPFNSEFSRDGTFQSHAKIDDIDFVFTIWAAKATPRMQQWHAKGDKYFSFTFQGYDTLRRLRDPFRTKRRVWLDRIRITSETTTTSGAVEAPYGLDAWAPDITFDPEARTHGKLGMLITSPKGAFELRNQRLGDLADDTQGVTLTFTATVHIQESAGAKRFVEQQITQVIPIAMFPSSDGEPTRPQPVPYNAS